MVMDKITQPVSLSLPKMVKLRILDFVDNIILLDSMNEIVTLNCSQMNLHLTKTHKEHSNGEFDFITEVFKSAKN